MDAYLWWSGLILNLAVIIFVLLCVWVWFVWPGVEAVSMVRYYKEIARKYPDVKLKSVLRLFISCYEPFGRHFEATRCSYGEWCGVGEWRVFDND